MVVKTDLCHFTEYKIYPGRGMRYVAKDGKISIFLSSKASHLWHMKAKAVKLTWTQAWRRMNKKGKVESSTRKKKGRTMRFQKAIVGMSLEDLKRKKAAKTTMRAEAKEVAVKEAKARKEKGGKKPQTQNKPMGKQQKNTGAAKNFKAK